LLDLAAGDCPVFKAGRLAGALAAVFFRAATVPDFLRVFLDIRLPFVAFRGSIIEVLDQVGYRAGQFGLFGLCAKGF
jgi:hypothetical protein